MGVYKHRVDSLALFLETIAAISLYRSLYSNVSLSSHSLYSHSLSFRSMWSGLWCKDLGNDGISG